MGSGLRGDRQEGEGASELREYMSLLTVLPILNSILIRPVINFEKVPAPASLPKAIMTKVTIFCDFPSRLPIENESILYKQGGHF